MKRKPEDKQTDNERKEAAGGILGGIGGFLDSLGNLANAAERQAARRTGSGGKEVPRESSIGRILGGLTDIVEKLDELSERGESLKKEGKFTVPGREGDIKGVYGFSFKMGLGEQEGRVRADPFGNIHRDKKTGRVVVQEIREPLVDVFEEGSATVLVAEMPGVGAEDVHVDVQGDVVTLSAEKDEKKYRKEILLSHAVDSDGVRVTCNNGVVTIRCPGTE